MKDLVYINGSLHSPYQLLAEESFVDVSMLVDLQVHLIFYDYESFL